MLTWIIGLIAVALWTTATLLYLRGPIKRALAERRKRKEMEAKIREAQAKNQPPG
jgi:hypothetical protein